LLDRGYGDVTVLDISEAELIRSKTRLGQRSELIRWISGDITTWTPQRTWNIWHDRAVFHFMIDPEVRAKYTSALKAATKPDSYAIIATFGPDGPDRCSGLPIQRYSAEDLAAQIGAPFTLVHQKSERHITPNGMTQNFIYAVLKRT
jgi:hypothetical protein